MRVCVGDPGSDRMVVLLDGRPVPRATEADSDEGYVVAYVMQGGKIQTNEHGEPRLERRRGRVRILDGGHLRRVVVESPYAGDESNVAFARACMRDALLRGEAPLASHLLYTQEGVLRDEDAAERRLGIWAGFCWGRFADAVVVYTDRGVSPGMRLGIDRAEALGLPVEYRSLEG